MKGRFDDYSHEAVASAVADLPVGESTTILGHRVRKVRVRSDSGTYTSYIEVDGQRVNGPDAAARKITGKSLQYIGKSDTGGMTFAIGKAADPNRLDMLLRSAVTEFDRKQEGKRGYNPNALALYLGAVDDAMSEIRSGKDVDSALRNNFNDRLLTAVQNAARRA